MENKQSDRTFLKYIAASNQQPHTHCVPSTLLGTGRDDTEFHRQGVPSPLGKQDTEQVKTTTTTSILEVFKTLMGEVRQCRL